MKSLEQVLAPHVRYMKAEAVFSQVHGEDSMGQSGSMLNTCLVYHKLSVGGGGGGGASKGNVHGGWELPYP